MVFLNNRDTPEANRFGLFHEVFHILAHSQRTHLSNISSSLRGSFIEGFADYFVMAVLMSRVRVHEKWTEIQDATGIAELFKPLSQPTSIVITQDEKHKYGQLTSLIHRVYTVINTLCISVYYSLSHIFHTGVMTPIFISQYWKYDTK